MRLGIASGLQHSNPEEWAYNLHELGCRSVVFPVDYTCKKQLINEYVQAAKKYDLLIAEVGCWCNPISLNVEERASAIERCIGQLTLADEIGANCCVNVIGARGEQWAGAYLDNFSEELWHVAVKSVQEIIDAVNPQNTFYAIEPMPWMIPMDPDQYLQLIHAVNRKHIAVHMDVVNWITSPQKYFLNDDFIDECFDKLGDIIKSCHLKDIAQQDGFTWHVNEVPCGEGILNLEKYAKRAHELNSDIPMIIEHLKDEKQYRESFQYTRKRLEQWLT